MIWRTFTASAAALATMVIFMTTPARGAAPTDSAEKATFERDRQAILSMAGEYRVKFRFLETVPLRVGYELKPPYAAGATELVEVIEDTGDRIVLQHVLVTDGEEDGDEAHVVKHWRQDWTYEDTRLYEFKGHQTWAPRALTPEEAEGTWSQKVFQVDDSPRYQGFGKWTHLENASSWTSNQTWRPLPRREFTKRKDYHVLGCVNRHTITPAGWFHEQDNYKLVLPEAGDAVDQPVLVREAGLNEYTKVSDIDFTAGRQYWQDTQAYWKDVRAAWDELFAAGKAIRLRKTVDDEPLHRHLFEQADAMRQTGRHDAAEIRALLAEFLIEDEPPRQTAAR